MKLESIVNGGAIIGSALCFASATALAADACPLTYAYVGTVTDVSPGTYSAIPIGAKVTGTYTFDRGNAAVKRGRPSRANRGPAGATGWKVANGGVTLGGTASPVPAGFVFSSTARVGGYTYTSSRPVALAQLFYSSYGTAGGVGTATTYAANETQSELNGTTSTSSLYISNSDGTTPFGPSGMPEFTSASTATGEFETWEAADGSADFGYVDFKISALIPVAGTRHCDAWQD
jgi:hypothetical protein